MPYTDNTCEICGKNCKEERCYVCSNKRKQDLAKAQKKYQSTEKGKQSQSKANRKYYINNKENVVRVDSGVPNFIWDYWQNDSIEEPILPE